MAQIGQAYLTPVTSCCWMVRSIDVTPINSHCCAKASFLPTSTSTLSRTTKKADAPPTCQPGEHLASEVVVGSVFTIYRCVRCGEEEWL